MAMSFKKQMLNRATANRYNTKDYYYVLKCDKCNSFIPDSVEGNFNHHIFDDKIVD